MKDWTSYEKTSEGNFFRIVIDQRGQSRKKKVVKSPNFKNTIYFDDSGVISGWIVETRGQRPNKRTYFIRVLNIRE